ncbi:MAG: DNA gyrase subunit B [Clostridia bacterium]
MTQSDYSAKNLEVLEGLSPVRTRPGMYIGGTDVRGLHHLVWEIVDNAIDEAANKYANKIDVIINKDQSISVEDNGRGMPVDMHPDYKVPGVELIFTKLHAGGKFNALNYNFSGGLHGVGASVTNALSEWLVVEVYRDKKIYREEFHSPKEGDVIISGAVKTPLSVVGKTQKHGSKVTFLPDKRVFTYGTKFDAEIIENRLRELAFLNKGISISFQDKRDEDSQLLEFCFKGGISDYVMYINEDSDEVKNKVIYLERKTKNFELELAIQHVEVYTDRLYSFVNNINTIEGGWHETGFKSAFTKCFNDYARTNKFLKEKDKNLLGDDFKEGMTAVLSIKMHDPLFEGQTKTKLGNPEVKTIVEGIVNEELSSFLNNTKNKTISEFIMKQALSAAKVRVAASKTKELQRNKNSITNSTLIGKLASCSSQEVLKRELFIVEGNSAGGTAIQGRDRRYQAILPLRGKPLNVMKVKKRAAIYENEEIRNIVAAIGTDTESDFNIDNLKYDKIIILSDADYDGFHIRTLLLAMFYRLTKELILQGKIYVGMPPLYRVSKGNDSKYAYDDEELEKVMEEYKTNCKIQRYKGLGEMNPAQLWETTLNPRQRMLTRVTLDDAVEADNLMTIFMCEEAIKRKNYIFKHANFNKEDNFMTKYGG